jgi:hypothetical protein
VAFQAILRNVRGLSLRHGSLLTCQKTKEKN